MPSVGPSIFGGPMTEVPVMTGICRCPKFAYEKKRKFVGRENSEISSRVCKTSKLLDWDKYYTILEIIQSGSNDNEYISLRVIF